MYSVSYSCSNCSWAGKLNFDLGTLAPDKTQCPGCNCFAAQKGWSRTPVTPNWDYTIPIFPKRTFYDRECINDLIAR